MKFYIGASRLLHRKLENGEWEYFSHIFGVWRPDISRGTKARGADGPYSLEEIIEIGLEIWDSGRYRDTLDDLI